MPTNLPIRSKDNPYGRKRGIPRVAVVLVLWAVTMIALTVPVKTAHTASFDAIDVVMP